MFRDISLTFTLFLSILTAGLCLNVAQAQKPILLEGHKNVVSAVTFSPDGKRLISASWDKTLRLWDLESETVTATLNGHRDWVFAFSLSADGSKLKSASQRAIRLWDLNSFSEIAVHPGLGGATVSSLAFSPDGTLLATGRRDGTAKLRQVDNEKHETAFRGFESWVGSIVISPDNKTLAAGTRSGRIRLFGLTTNKEKIAINAHAGQQVMTLAVNPASDTLASGSYDKTIKLWDLNTGKEKSKLTGHKGVITALVWSADGKLLASAERHGQIKLWNIAGGNRLIATLPGHSDNRLGFSVTALAFSPDGRKLASGSYDKTIKIWRVPVE